MNEHFLSCNYVTTDPLCAPRVACPRASGVFRCFRTSDTITRIQVPGYRIRNVQLSRARTRGRQPCRGPPKNESWLQLLLPSLLLLLLLLLLLSPMHPTPPPPQPPAANLHLRSGRALPLIAVLALPPAAQRQGLSLLSEGRQACHFTPDAHLAAPSHA